MQRKASYSAPLSQLARSERPQERLEKIGPQSLSDAELLATLLRTGRPGMNILHLCQELLAESGSLSGLMRFDASDFQRFYGVGKVKSLQLVALMEMARRIVSCQLEVKPILDTPEKVFRWLHPRTQGLDVERFWVLCLNRKNRLIHDLSISSGTATASLVHPREVFRAAIRHAATAIICAHNHPSGDPSPSGADINVTRQLHRAAEAVQIDLLDHIIIGHIPHDPHGRGFYSFVEGGII